MITKIKIVDRSEYDPARCGTGGAYEYTTTYRRLPLYMSRWEVTYSSSSDFEMCPFCGDFAPCICGREEPEVFTSDEVNADVRKAEADDDMDIYIVAELQLHEARKSGLDINV